MINLGQRVAYTSPYNLNDGQARIARSSVDIRLGSSMKRIGFVLSPPDGLNDLYASPEVALSLYWTKQADGRTRVNVEGCEFVKDKGIGLINKIDSVLKRAEQLSDEEVRGIDCLPVEFQAA